MKVGDKDAAVQDKIKGVESATSGSARFEHINEEKKKIQVCPLNKIKFQFKVSEDLTWGPL